MPPFPRHITLFGLISKHPGRNRGGTAVVISRLADFFSQSGLTVSIVMRRPQSGHFLLGKPGVKYHLIHAESKAGIFLELLGYVLSTRTDRLLAIDSKACRIASWIKTIPGLKARVWASFHYPFSEKKRDILSGIARRCDGVILVSRGLAEDFLRIASAPKRKVHVIHNPVVTPELLEAAEKDVYHPWFLEPDIPIMVGVGRMVPEKGFEILLRAFERVRRSRAVRLMLLGEGPGREMLEQESVDLGIREYVDFCGFRENPWAFMKKASLLVSSSFREAFGNVIAEALALGVPVVATDCPHGPKEILDGGRLGRLVPVGDDKELARAVIETLEDPLPSEVLKAGARRFRSEYIGQRYLDVMGLN